MSKVVRIARDDQGSPLLRVSPVHKERVSSDHGPLGCDRVLFGRYVAAFRRKVVGSYQTIRPYIEQVGLEVTL
jgi:hypothetical protein